VTPRAIVVGPPGSGKSTVGALLARRLEVPFRDTDDLIVEQAGRSISDIFTTDGEPAFRALEEEVVAAALTEHDGVLALGGGSVLSERTRERLGGHRVVFLNVGMSEGVRRVGLSSARPLLAGVNPRATYKALLDERLPVYRSVATIEVGTDHRGPDEVVALITAELGASGVTPGPRQSTVEY
jgi:shikimate kinase